TGRRDIPGEDRAHEQDLWSLFAALPILAQVDWEPHGVVNAVRWNADDVVDTNVGGTETGFRRAVAVEVGPERHVFAASIRAGATRIACGFLDLYHADELIGRIGIQTDAFQLFEARIAIRGREQHADDAGIDAYARIQLQECLGAQRCRRRRESQQLFV